MPGPLPSENTRRRNAPTIPTTELSASGRKGRAPGLPDHYTLGKSGRAWWKWAWKLPQACAWDSGVLYVVARRAQLEDDLAAIEDADKLLGTLDDLLAEAVGEDDVDEFYKTLRAIERTMQKLKSLAGGRIGVMKEMRELDNRLGLNPKAMADLRWKIVDDGTPQVEPKRKAKSAKRGHLTAVK